MKISARFCFAANQTTWRIFIIRILFDNLAIGYGKFNIRSVNGAANHSLNRMFGKSKIPRIDLCPDCSN